MCPCALSSKCTAQNLLPNTLLVRCPPSLEPIIGHILSVLLVCADTGYWIGHTRYLFNNTPSKLGRSLTRSYVSAVTLCDNNYWHHAATNAKSPWGRHVRTPATVNE
uniref:Uncharacterized protein n=1 Tax=Sipha flava TaxID=143950 RepID=A0A2S2QTR1_9HEMI